MLIVSRRVNEEIQIGDDITVMIVYLKGNRIGVGVKAPKDVPVNRKELNEEDVTDAT